MHPFDPNDAFTPGTFSATIVNMSVDPVIRCTGFRCTGFQRRWVRCFVGWLLACPALLATHSILAGEQDHGPLSPQREAATFQLADDGLIVELVAAEPNVNSPVAVAWDADGRMYVAEMIDYPLGPAAGRIRLLEDRDHDGRYEQATVFADGLSFPNGVLCLSDGVLVTAAPDIWRLRDRDGDGVADEREVLFTGFGQGNQQLRVNGLTWGLDNWIYGANGRSDGEIRRPNDPPEQTISIRTRDFRFRPDGSRFEALVGQSQFGQTRDDYGNRFLSWNTVAIRQALFDDAALDRNPRLAAAAVHDLAARIDQSELADRGEVFPISPRPQTFNRERTDFYNALCGLTIYRGDALGDEYEGNAFVGESLTNLVHRRVLKPDGPTFVSLRGEQGREFLASSDPWFHPVYMATGPDGTLYVVDFYRRWVEHPQFVAEKPRGEVDWREGAAHGRIWRIRRRDVAPAPAHRLSRVTSTELVEHLSDSNGWVRDTAQRLLVEQHLTRAVPLLRKLLAEGASLKGRLHALWTLDGLNALDDDTLVAVLRDPSVALREQALRLVQPRCAESTPLREALLALADDPNGAIRFRLALALGARNSGASDSRAAHRYEHLAELVKLAKTIDKEPWTALALSGSLGTTAGPLLDELVKDDPDWLDRPTPGQIGFLVQVGQSLGGRTGDREALATTMELAVSQVSKGTRPGGLAIVVGVARGMTDVGRSFTATLREAASDGKPGWLDLVSALAAVRTLALDSEQAVEHRLAAIEVLGVADTAEHGKDLIRLLEAGVPQALQSAATAALAQMADVELAAEIFSGWNGFIRTTRRALIDSALRWPLTSAALVESLERGDILPVELEAFQREMLTKVRDKELAERARRVLAAAVPANREEVIARYQASLQLTGDRRRGAALFHQHCSACHAVRGIGHRVGPDLSGASAKPKESLLIDLLDPSRQVSPDQIAYTLATEDGQVFAGLLVAETATSVTLRRAEGLEITVLRGQIDELQASGTSLMPDGLEQQLTERDAADLLEFLSAPGD